MTLVFLLLLGFTSLCVGSRILVVVPFPSRSHAILFEELISELVAKGHEIVYVSPYPLPKPVNNTKEIILDGMAEKMNTNTDQTTSMLLKIPPIALVFLMPLMSHRLVESTMSCENFLKFLEADEKFDLVLGALALDEALLAGLSKKYDAPLVAVATAAPTIWINYLTDVPAPSSYIPEMLLSYTSEMSLHQRVINTVVSIINEFIHKFYHLPKQDELLKKYFGHELPAVQEIMKNTSVALINHHNVLAYPRPLMPNMIEIGGFHVPKPKILPQDLQKYMDESKDGVILFSMGSNVKSSAFPNETKSSILNAFSKLNQNVLWKFEDNTLTDLPKNVRILKWLPQSDILAHQNLKLFITHGGQLSTTEAIVRAIPVIGIPITVDQHPNMVQAEKLGFGKILNFNDINTDSLYDTITEVLTNPRYREAAKKISKLLQDTPLSPMDMALFWIEYVIRNDGAPHFRSAAADLYWYQLYSIDVAVILVLISCLSWACTFYSCRFIYRKTCGKKCKKVTSDKKLN